MSDEIRSGAEVLPPRPKTVREKAAELARMTEEEKRKTRCCFTGHRPQKLRRPVDDIKVDLENEILAAIREGCTTFITGMACGTDIWAGKIVIRLKDHFPDLKLIAAIPFPGFTESWDLEWQEKYESLISAADLVKVISPEFSENAYQARNQWMVDHSGRVIAVYDGKAGGTRNTISYARKNRVQVRCLAG
jgi:uncharacterized phage-like protein YoqJ